MGCKQNTTGVAITRACPSDSFLSRRKMLSIELLLYFDIPIIATSKDRVIET